jgi:hypothetical protein
MTAVNPTTTKTADDPATEQAKKTIAEERKVAEKSRAEFAERTKGKPTPTQEENDLAMHGVHILEHEDDGSGPDPFNNRTENRHVEADKSQAKPQTYATRQAQPTPTRSE